MTEEEKTQDILKKEAELKRLKSFLPDDSAIIISKLNLLHRIKKEQAHALDEKIYPLSLDLQGQVSRFLESLISQNSKQDMHKIAGILIEGEDTKGGLVSMVVEKSFNLGVDSVGNTYLLAGSGEVRVDNGLLKRENICQTFDDCVELCKRISSYWKGVASLSCHDRLLEIDGKIVFVYNLAGLIHENAKSLQN